jgi:uncharacterized protein
MEITVKRSLMIIPQVLLICIFVTNAWGLTNYEQCVETYLAKDFTNAYRFCKEANDPNAKFIIGEMYYNGLGVKKDIAEAAKWIRKAAQQDLAEAQFVLCHMHYYGLGVKEDHAEALVWCRKAAEHGHIRARLLRDKILYQDKSK